MGVGASNLSTTDLSVYQSALTKISQDLLNSTSNASGIDLQSTQTINFLNGVLPNGQPTTNLCTTFSQNKKDFIDLCQHGIIQNQTYPPSSPQSGQIVVESSGCDYFLSIGAITPDEWQTCYKSCATQAEEIYPMCTADQILAMTPTINCNININQVSSQKSSTIQAAESTVNASMTTGITNRFESDIDKTINQTNKDLNFQQFNSSDERSSVSQSIRNDITNAISNSSQNISTSYQNSSQIVNFTNEGVINCQGCTSPTFKRPTPPPRAIPIVNSFPTNNCEISINQSNLQDAAVNQKATAALQSIFDNAVSNDLTSKYKLAVTQTNEGINLLSLLLPFIIILALVVVCGLVGGWILKNIMNSQMLKPIGWAMFVIIIMAAVVFLSLFLGCQLNNVLPNVLPYCATKNTSSPSPSPTSSPTSSPSPTPNPHPPNALCPQTGNVGCVYHDYQTCADAGRRASPRVSCNYNYNLNHLYCGPC
jgi:hypothetical protein